MTELRDLVHRDSQSCVAIEIATSASRDRPLTRILWRCRFMADSRSNK